MTEWIPTSERTPSHPGLYLITVFYPSYSGRGTRETKTAEFYRDAKNVPRWKNTTGTVKAWAEMPAPYDGE